MVTTQPDLAGVEPAHRLGGIFRWLRAAFLATIAGESLMLVGSVLVLLQDAPAYAPDAPLSVGEGIAGLGGVAYLVALIASVVLFSRFSHRAMANLHKWGSRSAIMSPLMSWLWYLVPIANLFKPLEAMRQIWDGTKETARHGLSVGQSIGWWWAFWIVTSISGNASYRIDPGPDGGTRDISIWIDILSCATGIAAALIILPVLRKIAHAQDSVADVNVFD